MAIPHFNIVDEELLLPTTAPNTLYNYSSVQIKQTFIRFIEQCLHD